MKWLAALAVATGISPRELRLCSLEDLHAMSALIAERSPGE